MSERTLHERVIEIRGFKYIKLKSGRLITYFDAREAAERAETDLSRAVSRAVKLANANDDPEMRAYDLERVRWFIDNLASYIGAVRAHLDKLDGVRAQEERIARLRVTTGRTPEETELFARKADELEQKLRASGDRP